VEQVVRRDIHRPHDPLAAVAEVEHIHARRRLLERAEVHPLAGEREGENGPIDSAVQHRQGRLPSVVLDEPAEGGHDAVEQLADRLAAEEARIVRDHSAEGVDELLAQEIRWDLGEAAALELAELGPRLRLDVRCDDRGGLEGPRKAARHDAIELDAAEGLGHCPCLRDALLVQRHLRRIDRGAVVGEVRHFRMAHEIEPPAHRRRIASVAGADIVESDADAEGLAKPPLLVLDRVRAFLDEHGLGAGELRAHRVGEGGGSNFTFLLQRESSWFVLRRPPRPPLPPTAHDMVREARLQLAVREGGFVRLPTIVAVCEDESLLGVPFYVMDYLDGHVPTDELPPGLEEESARRSLGDDLVDTLVEIHAADVTTPGLAAFARPGNYNERQVRRFAQLWDVNKTRELPRVPEVGAWLADKLPEPLPPTVVHGDFRLGNTMVAREDPRDIVAVLDWEMGAIGDPRADLGYLLATYSEPGGPPNPLGTSPVTALAGFPSRAELVARYVAQSGRDVDPLPWFEALALWKAAVFCEAIYGRYLRGELGAEDTRAVRFREGVPYLADAAASALSLA
jgi:aminoglycoside phosphotransferase (APT) family kinase protein